MTARPWAAWALAGLLWSSAATATAGSAVAVAGGARARILLPPGATVEPYEAAGYRLHVADGEAVVTVDASPVESRSLDRPPAHWKGEPSGVEHRGDDPIARVARARVAGATREYEAASRILAWVAREITYDLDRDASQDALDVLARRSGYCTGVARLTVALLTAAGLDAREVAGYVAEESSRGYHRWVEVRLADRGWLMSDPLRSHHFVPATYLRLASERLELGVGVEGLLLERDDRLVAVDLEPVPAPDLRIRRNHDRQRAAALRVEVMASDDRGADGVGDTGGRVVLEGRSSRHATELRDGGATFLGLDGGDYRLRVEWPGGAVERRVALVAQERTEVRLSRRTPE